MRPRLLQLSPHPLDVRLVGPQRRAGAILDAYRRHGIDARPLAIYQASRYPDYHGADGIALDASATVPPEHEEDIGETQAASTFLARPDLLDELRARWQRFDPDFVQIEQPFLWPVVKHLFASGHVRRVPVIHSSHNVESDLRPRIRAAWASQQDARDLAAELVAIEADLCRCAALCLAVTPRDAGRLRHFGAQRCLVARNGADRRAPSARCLAHWRSVLLSRWRAFAVFVSRPFAPSYEGMARLLGPQLTYLPPDVGIVLVGGIGPLARRFPDYAPGMLLNESRLHLVPEASDDDVAALLHLARAVLLPIVAETGSNQKTAEALLAQRPVIATSAAFRGFEEYAQHDGVTLADEPRAFREAMQAALLLSTDAVGGAGVRDEALGRPALKGRGYPLAKPGEPGCQKGVPHRATITCATARFSGLSQECSPVPLGRGGQAPRTFTPSPPLLPEFRGGGNSHDDALTWRHIADELAQAVTRILHERDARADAA